jgi:hypothetical protein
MRFILISMLLTVPVLAAPRVAIGENGFTEHEVYACKAQADRDKFNQLIASDDALAVGRFMSLKEGRRECVLLPAGLRVHVDTASVFGVYCVRPVGQIDCLWTDDTAVRK